jgi:hypothetical protein
VGDDAGTLDTAVLFSGGRDSALAALLLSPHVRVTLLTCSAGVTEDWRHAREAAACLRADADALDWQFAPEFRRVELDRAVLADAAERVRADGYPREGVQRVHEHAVERVATLEFDAVADGTRRDDRTPRLDRSTAQSVEDRHGVDYLAPLAGFGHGAVRAMAGEWLRVERGPSETVGRADYESELRALIRARGGDVDELFPAHEQSRVTGVRA